MDVRRWLTIFATAVGGGLAVLLLSSCNPIPTRYLVVTTTADGRDAAPGNGVCEVTPGAGDCSLRAAVDEANVTTIRVDIAVPAGQYPLTLLAQYDDDTNAVGDLDLASPAPSIGIHSSGTGAIVDQSIDGLGDRMDGSIDVHTGNVGMAYVSTRGGGGDVGIRARAGASVTTFGGSVTGHQVGFQVLEGGVLRTSYTSVTSNWAAGYDGQGTLAIDHGLVTTGQIGVYLLRGSATIEDSIIRDNTGSSLLGGGVVVGGILTDQEIDVAIRRTTITGNGAPIGGGVMFDFGHLTIEDSTIVDNAVGATNTPVGVAIGVSSNIFGLPLPTATIVRSTITESTTAAPLPTAVQAYQGTITVSSSIVQAAGSDCAGSIQSGGRNLFTDSTCAFAAPGDQLVVDPLLGPLAFNGGLTSTRLPDAGSPAVDAIPFGTVGLCDATTPRDQRGVVRPQGTACDIGAVERDASP